MVSWIRKPRLPHLVFIESACPAFLASYSEGNFFIYTKYSSQFALSHRGMVVVSNLWMKVLKILAALFRFPCTFQGGFGLACRLSKNKSVISDGLLTEWLYQCGYIKPKIFISVADLESQFNVNPGQQLIIGSNWYEFGMLSLKKYEALLRAWKHLYPNACYFPHPKEARLIARKVFEDKLIEVGGSIDSYCKKNGIPGHVIGIGSTALASLGKLATSNVIIESVKISSHDCDGPNGDVIDPFLLSNKGIKVCLNDMSEITKIILKNSPLVTIKESHLLISNCY